MMPAQYTDACPSSNMQQNMANDSGTPLTPAQCLDFRRLAGMMIPPDAEFGIPGADDVAIFDDILRAIGRDLADVRAALTQLAALSGGAFAELDITRREAIAEAFLARDAPDMAALGRVVLQCYYRDDRVVRALGLEPRAPFPKGHTLEQGDWSLLDPVRSRPKMWRDVA
ncbi:MAG TPA: hypothetical protein VGG99_08590 [Acetobacteraceae bacterium]